MQEIRWIRFHLILFVKNLEIFLKKSKLYIESFGGSA